VTGASSGGFACRKVHVIIDEALSEAGLADGEPLRKVAVVAVGENPWAGRHGDDLSEMIAWGAALGTLLGERAARELAAPVVSYGKAAIVGLFGEQEHGVALLTTSFGDALREAVGGGLAWISSATKRGAPGTVIDVPLAHKDALYVRDHYDALEVRVPDAPLPGEIVVIAVVTNRGRLHARCGGPSASQISARDGLR
jgi:hypothetical protein